VAELCPTGTEPLVIALNFSVHPKPSIDSFGTSEETIVTAVPFRDVDGAVIANRRM
jgi:hypothetical protein